ncbi:hypothetical protein B0H66DRAFT_603142 [Apodospora peruviana]|uniref:Zn(2)-C6 fungal-type domain-containing protein n=1 Tax=Apodospora peruviana TaxID=516989 RepID=A0AAE0I4T1_9PEZI|nr:hypothetical protein B0H66DRAFT_603142 [Apodospora peruviana]
MAGKGTQKVKTGCFTCKIRKVKCDEAKPFCNRCTKTGRKCDGYPPRPQGVYSWDELLSKRPIVPAITSRHTTQESRALDYFRAVVAPSFAGCADDYFWTRLVTQASYQHPAVRHAVVAISTIYEQLGEVHHEFIDSPRGRFALGHYNQALQQLTKACDETVVLFVCVLFVCIEILQENKQAAIDHCRHGVMIFNSARDKISTWQQEHLLPIYVRLSIFPFFFGGNVDNFPGLLDFHHDKLVPPITLDDSRSSLDMLVARSIRFIRTSVSSRFGPTPDLLIPPALVEEQQRLVLLLDGWLANFTAMNAQHPPPLDAQGLYYMLQMKSLVARIWVLACMDPEETKYDMYISTFVEIIDLAGLAIESQRHLPHHISKPKFIFEMGYLPLLYFVLIKCRHLETRLRALEYMSCLAVNRENLWDSTHMFSIGWRLIELEHGVDLETFRSTEAVMANAILDPPAEIRIRDPYNTGGDKSIVMEDGRSIPHRRVEFVVWDAEAGGGLKLIEGWVKLRQPCRWNTDDRQPSPCSSADLYGSP